MSPVRFLVVPLKKPNFFKEVWLFGVYKAFAHYGRIAVWIPASFFFLIPFSSIYFGYLSLLLLDLSDI